MKYIKPEIQKFDIPVAAFCQTVGSAASSSGCTNGDSLAGTQHCGPGGTPGWVCIDGANTGPVAPAVTAWCYVGTVALSGSGSRCQTGTGPS